MVEIDFEGVNKNWHSSPLVKVSKTRGEKTEVTSEIEDLAHVDRHAANLPDAAAR
jgi:hypothetical protein